MINLKKKKKTLIHIEEQTMRRFQGKEGRSWANKSWRSSFSTTQLSLSQSIMVLSKSKTTNTLSIEPPPKPSFCIDREFGCRKVAFRAKVLQTAYKDKAHVFVVRVELLMDTRSEVIEFIINTVWISLSTNGCCVCFFGGGNVHSEMCRILGCTPKLKNSYIYLVLYSMMTLMPFRVY